MLRALLRSAVMAAMLATMTLPAAAQSQSYVARGQEPGWSLTVTDSTIALRLAAGGHFEAANPVRDRMPPRGDYAVTLDGKPVRIAIEARICRDTMSGMPHPDSVTISGLNGELHGCGGAPRALLGTEEWSITEIGSSPLAAGTAPTIAFFDEGFVAGHGSCNRFRGGYTLTGEGLQIGKLASTMMACEPVAMAQEHALLQRLEATKSFDIRADGALILKDGSGGTLVAVKKPKG